MDRDVTAIIPVRGGSKRLHKKNVKELCGKPLIDYAIQSALFSESIDRIAVSTDDAEIAKIALEYGVIVIDRPAELAKDNTPSLPVLHHAVQYLVGMEKLALDIVVTLQVTSPLRTPEDIDEAVKQYISTSCDSVISGFWEGQMYLMNGAIYICSADLLMNKSMTWGPNIVMYEMPKERSVDIDTMEDFKLAEKILYDTGKEVKVCQT